MAETKQELAAEFQQIASLLKESDAVLANFTATVENDFLKLGEVLSQAVGIFSGLANSFSGLAKELQNHPANKAAIELKEAMDGIIKLSGANSQVIPILLKLESGALEVENRLLMMGKIISEVGALAINGKIQAALVSKGGIDFSVFTQEIGRLGSIAEESTQQAGSRLHAVRQAVLSARKTAEDFGRNEARELETLQERIQKSLSGFAASQHKAEKAAHAVATKSEEIARKITAAVGDLQINDNLCQRIGHIRTAFALMAKCLADSPDLAGGLGHLQIAQLKGGCTDYHQAVEELIKNLAGLANDAANILHEAELAFGSRKENLFIVEIEQDIEKAWRLVSAYGQERGNAEKVVEAVSHGFEAMAQDLEVIQSIDIDMRVMGLNATLKCGRLGKDGLALGIIAQELRSCSRRTEEYSHGIVRMLENVMETSNRLASLSNHDVNAEIMAITDIVGSSHKDFVSLRESIANTISILESDTENTSCVLVDTHKNIDVHKRLDKISLGIIDKLQPLINSLMDETNIDSNIHKNIHDIVYSHYTMDRERAIHKAFSRDDTIITANNVPDCTNNSDDLENLFF